jgi:N-acetylglucosamine transport system permease protein
MHHRKYPFVLAFLAPGLLVYGIFMLSPYAQAIWFSFTDWSGLGRATDIEFIGFGNYLRLLDDEQLRVALRNNFILLIVVPVVTLLIALFLASMLNVGGRRRGAAVTGVRGSAVYKVVYFFPLVLSTAIVAVLFNYVFAPARAGGVLNTISNAIGVDWVLERIRGEGRGEILWFGEPAFLIWIIAVVMIWSFVGFFVVVFSAAMQSIPRDIYEAALLDGSSRFNTFRRLTVPLVWDTVKVSWVYLAIQAMDAFALVHIILGVNGGPDGQGDVLGVAVYRAAFAESNAAYAATIGVLLLLLTMAITLMFMRALRRERVELA